MSPITDGMIGTMIIFGAEHKDLKAHIQKDPTLDKQLEWRNYSVHYDTVDQ